jgi:site-specific DNA recombinase
VLHNTTYIGEAYYGKSYGVVPEHPYKIEKYKKQKKTSRRIRPPDQWIKIAVPPILDREMFLRVQERLKSNFALAQRHTKNQYLLAGKLWCACGNRRTGSGAQQGKHLYYGCTEKVRNFPFPSTCENRAVNARIADDLAWRKVSQLMSSPELLGKQLQRWIERRQRKAERGDVDVTVMEKEIARVRSEEDRYNKAYGAGLLSIGQLREYTIPIREKITSLQAQIATVNVKTAVSAKINLPSQEQIQEFAAKATTMLRRLNFGAKRAIVRSVVERCVISRDELRIDGFIPLENSNVELCSDHRHGLNTIASAEGQVVPFEFLVKLPSPRYSRTIVRRDEQGRILRSVA